MNKSLSLLLRVVGFNRAAPKTRMSRILRRSERTLTILLVIYASLHAFPQVLFAHSVTAEGITIYSRTPLPPGAAGCARRTAALVQQSELAVPGRREHIFVCDSPWLSNPPAPMSIRLITLLPLVDAEGAVGFHEGE